MPSQPLSFLDGLIVLLFIGGSLLIGYFLLWRARHSTDEYFKGGVATWDFHGGDSLCCGYSTPLALTSWVVIKGLSQNWFCWSMVPIDVRSQEIGKEVTSPEGVSRNRVLMVHGIKLNTHPLCRRLLKHRVVWALPLARERSGRSMPARMAMMAMTTRSSIRVKALALWEDEVVGCMASLADAHGPPASCQAHPPISLRNC